MVLGAELAMSPCTMKQKTHPQTRPHEHDGLADPEELRGGILFDEGAERVLGPPCDTVGVREDDAHGGQRGVRGEPLSWAGRLCACEEDGDTSRQ